jgi:succinyl-diaminopimelate desuccinylase
MLNRDSNLADICPRLTPALEVWEAVQAQPEPDLAFATMGKRDVSYDVEMPVAVYCLLHERVQRPQPTPGGVTADRLNDQHTFITTPDPSPFEIGDMIGFGISHVCTTLDKWRSVLLVDDDDSVSGAIRTYFQPIPHDRVDERHPMTQHSEVLNLTRELLAIDTIDPPGNEEVAARIVAKVLHAEGIETNFQEIAPGRTNLIGRLRGTGGRPALSMSAHFDTIGVDPETWTKDAFAGEIVDGRVYGRGSTDMKGGMAAMAMAAIEIKRAGTPLRGDLVLHFTAAENSSLLGAKALVEGKFLDGVGALLNSEPSSMRLFVSEKGTVWIRATAKGDTGHSAFRDGETGDRGNAIVRLARFIDKVYDLDLNAPEHRHLKPPTINPGVISGGFSTPLIPSKAVCDIDVRLVPGLDGEDVLTAFREIAGEHITLEMLDSKPPVDTPDDDPFVKLCLGALKDKTGYEGGPEGVPYYSDCAVIAPVLNLPMVIIGPGEVGHSGNPDEYCEISNLEAAVGVYRTIAERYLA